MKKIQITKKVIPLLIITAVLLFGFKLNKSLAAVNEWENVGSELSANGVQYTDIAFNPSTNEPYAVFQDAGSSPSYKATVKKFDGENWVLVGTRGFTPGRANYNAISFNPVTNLPYIAFQDEANSSKLSVMKFNGTSWEVVGSFGVSSSTVSNKKRHIAFNLAGDPFVVYEDSGNSYKSVVKKFNGSTWETLGDVGLLSNRCEDSNIATNAEDDKPYVVCTDSASSNKITVMKFNDPSWAVAGNAGFSSGIADSGVIGVNSFSSNEVFVAFNDYARSGNITVMVLNGSTWENLGDPGFVSGGANMELAFVPDDTGYAYVGFDDSVMKYQSGWSVVGASTVHYDGGIAFSPDTAIPYVVHLKNVLKFNLGAAAAPTASPSGATFTSAQSVTLSTTTSGATIYYTTDGSAPTRSSISYSGTIDVSASETIKAIAVKSSLENSGVMEESYIINIPGVVSTPTTSPSGGTFTSNQTVSLSTATSGATIYYTTNGSTPTVSSTQYSSSISITSSVVLKAIAVKSEMTDSSVMTSSYTINKSSSSSNHGGGKKKKSKAKKYSISSTKSVKRGAVLVQRGKKFSKSSDVALYFEKQFGVYYAPMIIKTSATGAFFIKYKVPANKPPGTYKWYAVDLKTGKKSKIVAYKIR